MSSKTGRPARARRLALLSTSMAVTGALILPAQHATAAPPTSPSVGTAHGNGNGNGNAYGNGNASGSGKHVKPQSIFDLTGLTTLAPNQKPSSSDTTTNTTNTTNTKSSGTAPTKAKSTGKASGKSKVAARNGAPAKTPKHTVKKPLPPKAQAAIRSAQAAEVVLGVPGLSAPAYTGSTAPVALPAAVTVRALAQPQPLPTLTAPSGGNPALNALRRIEQLTAESLGGDGLSAALVAAFMAVFGIGLALGATRRAATR